MPSTFGPREALRVRDTCHCLNARRLARALTNRYDEALKPAGLKMTQFSALAHVRAVGEIGLNELAEAMDLDQTTLSRNAEVLRRDGLLAIAKSGRRRLIALTPAGEALLDRAYPLWESAQNDATAAMGTTIP
jgi:DNA-binding MarR family transcriptional regulator